MRDDDTITIGGPMPWFSVSLAIVAEDLDPDEVTHLLALEPDIVRRRGVHWPVPASGDRPAGLSSLPAIKGAWLMRLRPAAAPGCRVEAAITQILDRVAGVPPEAWRQIFAIAKPRIAVGLTLDSYNRGFALEAALLRRAADLDLDMGFNIYDGNDENDPSEETATTSAGE